MPFIRKHQPPDFYVLKDLCLLYNVPEIATRFLISNATVRRWLRRAGLSAKPRVRQPLRLARGRGSEWHTQKRAVNKKLVQGKTCVAISVKIRIPLKRVRTLTLEEPDPVGYVALLEWALEQEVRPDTALKMAVRWVRRNPDLERPLYLRYKRQWWRRKP